MIQWRFGFERDFYAVGFTMFLKKIAGKKEINIFFQTPFRPSSLIFMLVMIFHCLKVPHH